MIIGRFLRRKGFVEGCDKLADAFKPGAIASACIHPRMSASSSVPRMSRPSEATSLRLFCPASITDIIFFMLCTIAADADDCSPPEPVPPSAM